MFSFMNLRTAALAGLMALGSLGMSAATAQAGHYGDSCQYKYVVCYETRCVPYTVCVTRYDHCGRPYQVEKVVYKHVQVAVTKRVPVCY